MNQFITPTDSGYTPLLDTDNIEAPIENSTEAFDVGSSVMGEMNTKASQTDEAPSMVDKAAAYFNGEELQSKQDYDLNILNTIGPEVLNGNTAVFDEIERPEYYKGLTVTKLIKNGFTEDDALRTVGITKEKMENANQGFFGNFVDGVKADYTEIAYGIRSMLLPEDKALQGERKHFMNSYENTNEFRKGLTVEYDEDGDADESWNWGAGIGEMALDVVGGFGAAAGTKTLAREILADVAFSSGTEYARYQHHGDKGRLAMGVGASVVGNAMGGILAHKMGWKKGGETLENKSIDQLTNQLEGLKFLEDSGIPSNALFGDTSLDDLITNSIKNPIERDIVREKVKNINNDLAKKLITFTDSIDTTPSNFAKYMNGELTQEQMGKKFKGWVDQQVLGMRAKENTLYGSLKGMDVDDAGNLNTYKVDSVDKATGTSLTDRLFAVTKDHRIAEDILQREMKFIQTAKSPRVVEMMGELTTISKELDGLPRQIYKAEQAADGWHKKKGLTELILDNPKKLEAYAKKMRMSEEDAIKSLGTQKREYTRALGEALDGENGLNMLNNRRRSLAASMTHKEKAIDRTSIALSGKDMKSMSDWTAEDLWLLQKRLNNKIHTAGGQMSLKDKEAIGALTRAKEELQDFMGKNIKNEQFNKSLKEADTTAAKRFSMFGKDSKIVGIAQALDHPNPKAMNDLVKGENGWHNLSVIKDMDPSLHRELVTKKIYDTVTNDIRMDTGVDDLTGGINYKQLHKNSSTKELFANIDDPAVEKTLRGLKYIAGVMSESIDASRRTPGTNLGDVIKSPIKSAKAILKQVHQLMIVDPQSGIDNVAGTSIRKFTQRHVPGARALNWYDEVADYGKEIAKAESRLRKAKSQTEALAAGNSLEQQTARLTKKLLESFAKGNIRKDK